MDILRRTVLRDGLLGGLGLTSAMGALNKSGVQARPSVAKPIPPVAGVAFRKARLNGVELGYAVAGRGPAMLLLHGWPFTWYTWHRLIPVLAKSYTVIAPDMRGIGESENTEGGYDVVTLADDAAAILSREGFDTANVLGHDLGVGVAFQLAARRPELVCRLALTESIVLGAPKAEAFMSTPPWWVAWHNVPVLPENVVAGREGVYLDWFYTNLTFGRSGISSDARNQHVAAYTGVRAMRGGFEHYRAFDQTTAQGRDASQRRLTMPVLALGGELVGDALHGQMSALSDHVTGGTIAGCGHVIHEEKPGELLGRLRAFL
jgi:pimeloyl-ACP methyl ester carboxylesterase